MTYRQRFKTPEQRFREKYVIRESRCWEWIGTVCVRGLPYGRFWLHGTNQAAHRSAWELFNGTIPLDLFVLHRCDNPKCVNPDHLFLGTAKQNTFDMMTKGRDAPCREANTGERSHQAKLTKDLVLEILRSRETQTRIAIRLGVSQTNIGRIRRRETWREVGI